MSDTAANESVRQRSEESARESAGGPAVGSPGGPADQRAQRPAQPQGTGFVRLRDPGQMRVILLWEVEVASGWEEAFERWDAKPLSLRAQGRGGRRVESYTGARATYFHRQVAERLVGYGADPLTKARKGGDRRRSLKLASCLDYRGQDGRILRIGALEVLRVNDDEGPGSAILVLHAVVPPPCETRYTGALAAGRRLREIGAEVDRLLARQEVCGPGRVCLAGDHRGRKQWFAPPLFTMTWVSYAVSAQWIPSAGESAAEMGRRLRVPISPDTVEALRQSMADPLSADRLPFPVLAAAGWQWGYRPDPDGAELGEGRYDQALEHAHMLSHSWAVSVWERGAAYMPRHPDDEFLLEGMHTMCSTDVDVHLLTALNRLRVRDLSRRLAATAQRVRAVRPATGQRADLTSQLDPLIDEAVRLDGEAVAFLASEWWTDITRHQHADLILGWAQEAGGLDRAVAQVVEQARLLRESLQTLMEREENIVDKERQRSARVLERAVAILTFVGLPLTIFMEIWINWDAAVGVRQRSAAWWACGAAVLAGTIVVGLLAASAFRAGGRSPSGRGPASALPPAEPAARRSPSGRGPASALPPAGRGPGMSAPGAAADDSR